MKKVTVITSYHDREENARIYNEMIRRIPKHTRKRIEFIVIANIKNELTLFSEVDNLGITCEPFNTGKYHNIAASEACGEWILKLDIDCIPHDDFWENLFTRISLTAMNFFNIGAYYAKKRMESFEPFDLLKNVRFEKYVPCGVQYCVHREYFERIGFSEVFSGYGYEDYATLYKMMYHSACKGYDDEMLTKHNGTAIFRDDYVKPMCKESKKFGLYVYHQPHEKQNKFSVFKNKKRFSAFVKKHLTKISECDTM